MFLDELLFEEGIKIDLSYESSINEHVINMFKICQNNLIKSIEEGKPKDISSKNRIIIANIKRIDNTWRVVCKKLESHFKESVLNPDGYKSIMIKEGLEVAFK